MFLQEITEAVQALDFSPEEVGKAEEILFPGESFESGSYYNGFLSSVDRVNNIVEIFHGKRQFVVEYGPDMLYIEGSSNRNIAKGTFITNYAKSRGIQVVLLDEGNELFEKGDELEPELEIEYKKSREPRWISNIQQNPPKGKSLAIAGIAHFKKMHDYPIYGEFPNLLGKAGIYFQLMEDLSLLIKPFDNYKI